LWCIAAAGVTSLPYTGGLDWGGHRAWVVSKGSRDRRVAPLSPEAMSWLARYLIPMVSQLQVGRCGGPVANRSEH
jgi:hypothetical protein